MANTLSYYPGCSLSTSSRLYDVSLKRVLGRFNVALAELDDWSCCGASAAPAIDEILALTLAARNVALAERASRVVLAPCSACYVRLRATNETLRSDWAMKERINRFLEPLSVSTGAEIRNIIEILHDMVGLSAISSGSRFDLSSLRVVPYYGCVLRRTMTMKSFDDRENPESMDRVLGATGARVLSWPYKMECCGAGKTVTEKEVTRRLSERIVTYAARLGADAIVTPCPLCQMNLDLLPYLGTEKTVPVLFLTEVVELALFGDLASPRSHIIPVQGILGKIGVGLADRKDPVLGTSTPRIKVSA